MTDDLNNLYRLRCLIKLKFGLFVCSRTSLLNLYSLANYFLCIGVKGRKPQQAFPFKLHVQTLGE